MKMDIQDRRAGSLRRIQDLRHQIADASRMLEHFGVQLTRLEAERKQEMERFNVMHNEMDINRGKG